MPPAEFEVWHRKYLAASQTLGDRDVELAAAAEEIERDMTIVGATAIEDELQDNVEHTIEKLHDAGIRLWVCTGDKLETAINIGYSCKVLLPVRFCCCCCLFRQVVCLFLAKSL